MNLNLNNNLKPILSNHHQQNYADMISQTLQLFLQHISIIHNTLDDLSLSIKIEVTPPKQLSHGDFTTNLAMHLTRILKKPPAKIAEEMIDFFKNSDANAAKYIDKYEIAGPGFINFHLNQNAKTRVLIDILRQGLSFGHQNNTNISQNKVILEFVSANPTGPLHIGHGRQAALGDALAALLQSQGIDVHKEFYYNDAGVQIQTLAQSVQLRAKGHQPGDEAWPEAAYNGTYIADIANDYLAKKSVYVKDIGWVNAKGDIEDFSALKDFSVAYLRAEQDKDLEAFGVLFDEYYLESSLYTSGRVDTVVERLIQQEKCYEQKSEQGTALYLKTTEYGDDKDRVMRKSNGDYTYFVPDIAYHYTKFQRGFNRAIDIQGFDHHGTIARLKAGLQALNQGVPDNFVDYILHKMVTVMKNGEEVKISKRAGSYVTLRDLIEWSSKEGDLEGGRDVVRFFLLSRKADSEFVFDVDLALQQNDENPVYYIQYAHARICSILRNAEANINTNQGFSLISALVFGNVTNPNANANQSITSNQINKKNKENINKNINEDVNEDLDEKLLNLLIHEKEHALIKYLSAYPDILKHASQEYAPHLITFYLRELSSLFHSFYNSCKIIQEDVQLMHARLMLLKATQLVLQNALAILGIRAPEKM